MSKQTAVEWLEEQINLGLSEKGLISAIKEAKQMEKEQIIDAYSTYACDEHGMPIYPSQYYNETYGDKI
jgi:hypothetical protein